MLCVVLSILVIQLRERVFSLYVKWDFIHSLSSCFFKLPVLTVLKRRVTQLAITDITSNELCHLLLLGFQTQKVNIFYLYPSPSYGVNSHMSNPGITYITITHFHFSDGDRFTMYYCSQFQKETIKH